MGCARTQLRTTIDEAREAVWNLRQAPPPVTSLGPLLGKMTQEVSREFGVPVECNMGGKPFEFQQETIHELLMVVREAIYNAVRHGYPSQIKLDINFEKNYCRLRVLDDGAGFDPEEVSSLPVGHYGLIGMKERVQRIGGNLELSSRSGAGTEVMFQIPRYAAAARDATELHVEL